MAVVSLLGSTELGPSGKLGVAMVANKSYDRAIHHLEAGLAETPDHPVLYEYLGIAYLGCAGSIDGAACLKKAEEMMDKAIALGGQATFIVDRSLEKQSLFIKNPNPLNMKRGYMHVKRDEVVFEPEKGPGDRITIAKSDLKEYGLNSSTGKSTNVFHINSRQAKYDFRTANFSADEARLLFHLIEKNLGVSAKK